MRMVENSKNLNKNFVTEEDISTILQRYTATTVLALLQEVAQVQGVKIDWDELVKKTTTGISNAREYQMLWRHLAYRGSMMDRLDDAAQPLDDDSDLECELEAFPGVSTEASAEAAACVKALIASGISNDPTGSTVEAPLTISLPKGQMSKAPENSLSSNCTLGTNIIVPISVQKQPMPTNNNAEGLDSNGAANANLPRRKRKPWSSTEDLELIAAVQKCGEGNWANILKGDFKGDRTASQLSQRWSILKKRVGNLNVGTGSQISDVHLATRRAVSMALGESPMPSSSIANAGANSNIVHSNLGQPACIEASPSAIPSLPSSQHDAALTAALGPMGSSKARIAPKKPSTTTKTALSPESMVSKSNLNPDAMPSKSTVSPDSLVKAAAFAAGARIATPSDAASLLKAAQSKNAVHIMPVGSLVKSSVAGTSNSLPSNVHFIRTGLVSRPLSSYSAAPTNVSQPSVTHQIQSPAAKPAATVTCSTSGAGAPDLSPTSDTKSTGLSVLPHGPDVKTVEKSSCTTVKEHVLEGEVGLTAKAPNNQMEADQNTVSNNSSMDVKVSANSLKDGDQLSVVSKSLEEQDGREKVSPVEALRVKEEQIDSKSSSLRATNGHHDIVGNDKSEISPVENNSKIPLANEGNHENGSVLQMKEGPEDMVVDGNEGGKLSQDGTCNEGTM